MPATDAAATKVCMCVMVLHEGVDDVFGPALGLNTNLLVWLQILLVVT
jgi:hypothetical protein